MNKGIVTEGLSRVLRRPALLGWLFVVNLLLGLCGSVAPRGVFARALDQSLHSRSLVTDFSLGAFTELISRPDVAFGSLLAQSYVFALLYLLITIFVAGGITSTYIEDRGLTRSEFFESSGRYFFRMLRLALLGLIPFALLAIPASVVAGVTSAVGGDSSAPPASFYVLVAGSFVVLVLALFVRAWFDLAQAYVVDRDQRSALISALRTFPIAARKSPMLVWAYLRIAVVSWAVIGGAIWIWLRIPHAAIVGSFLVLELSLVVSILMRLWQRATAIICYQRYAPIPSLSVPTESIQPTSTDAVENARPEQALEVSDVSAHQKVAEEDHRSL